MSIVHKGIVFDTVEEMVGHLEAKIENLEIGLKSAKEVGRQDNDQSWKNHGEIQKRDEQIVAHREAAKITTDVHATEIKSHKDRIEREKGIVEALAGNIRRAIEALNLEVLDKQRVVDILLDSDDDPCPMCKQPRKDGREG